MGRCTGPVPKLDLNQVRKEKNIEALKCHGDVVNLLIYMKHAYMNYKDKHHPCITLWHQFSAFHIFYQRDGMLIQKYLQIFQFIVENIERYGGEFGNHPATLKYVIEKEGLIHGDDFHNFDEDICWNMWSEIYVSRNLSYFLYVSRKN